MSATVLSRSSIAAGRSKAKAPPGAEPPREGRRTPPPPKARPPGGSSALPGPAETPFGREGRPPRRARGPSRAPARLRRALLPPGPGPANPPRPLGPPAWTGRVAPAGREGSGGEGKRPDPKSQSFSRSYGSVLPTSLTYVLLSARGFSPRRPAAVMSTAGRENDSLPSIFKGRRERTERFET